MDANIGADRILMGGYDAFNDAERNVTGIPRGVNVQNA